MSWNRIINPGGVKLGNLNNIDLDSYDLKTCSDILLKSSRFDTLSQKGERIYGPAFPPLVQDLWGIFYKAEPEMTPEEKVDPRYHKNRPLVERVLEDGLTKETRAFTMLDEISSALAAVETGEKLLEEIQNREELNNVFADQDTQDLNNAVGEVARTLRRAVRESLAQGQEAAQKLHAVLAGWGMEPADLKTVPPEERLELAYKLIENKRLKQIADMVGRFRNLARAKRREKLKKQRDEIHGITVGDDLGRVLPVELASLAHPVRKLDFYRRFSEKQLLVYELKENAPVGRGPIVCAVDSSGSMHSLIDNAVALSLSLVETAWRQRRSLALLFFNTQLVAEFRFPPGKKDLNALLQAASVGCDGGTDFVPPLSRAAEIIKEVEFKKADIVFITDGLCRVPEDFLTQLLKEKAEKGFRVWTVLLGGYSSNEEILDEVKKWSDKIWTVSSPGEAADEIFEEIV